MYPTSVDLQRQWRVCMENGALNYSLEPFEVRFIEGPLGLKVFLNTKRLKSKRKLGDFQSLKAEKNTVSFDFTKVKNQEIVWKDAEDSIIVNTSPASVNHFIFVPDIKSVLPQNLTSQSLLKAMKLLVRLNCPLLKVGFNSPFAGASINHLHYQGFFWESSKTPVERFQFSRLENCSNVFHCDMFYKRQYKLILDISDESMVKCSRLISKLAADLEDLDVAFNLMMTVHMDGKNEGESIDLYRRIDLYFCPRKPVREMYDWMATGFQELTGCVMVNNDDLFQTLTETEVSEFVKRSTLLSDEVYSQIEQSMRSYMSELAL